MPPTLRVGKGEGHGAQVVWRNAHIAVADDEDVVRGVGFHQLHGSDFGVDVVGLAAGGEELDRNVRMTRGHAARGFQALRRSQCARRKGFRMRGNPA